MTNNELMHKIQEIVNRWNMNGIPSINAVIEIEKLILEKQRQDWKDSH